MSPKLIPSDAHSSDGESSDTDGVFLTDTVQQNTTQGHFVHDTTTSESEDSDTDGSMVLDTMAGGWTLVSLTQETAQVALDAVRYRQNYVRAVTSRLCLHYIDTVHKRVSGGLTNYLFNVDGCESSDVEATGRCDIYNCHPFTYEVQITQTAAGSDVFMVKAVYKTADQKTLSEYRDEASNLDWSIAPDTEAAMTDESVIKQPTRTPVESEQPAALRGAVEAFLENDDEEEEPIPWTNDVNSFWQPTTTQQQVTTKPLSLRAEPMSLPGSQKPEVIGSDNPGATTVAIVGITAVAVSTIAFVFALVVARWRAQVKRTQHPRNHEFSAMRGTLDTAENTLSMTSRDSVGADTKHTDFEKVEFFT